ncbi:hypothetical protein BDW72DRAFT_181301 [Aspergillus terricola var. indicus]
MSLSWNRLGSIFGRWTAWSLGVSATREGANPVDLVWVVGIPPMLAAPDCAAPFGGRGSTLQLRCYLEHMKHVIVALLN